MYLNKSSMLHLNNSWYVLSASFPGCLLLCFLDHICNYGNLHWLKVAQRWQSIHLLWILRRTKRLV